MTDGSRVYLVTEFIGNGCHNQQIGQVESVPRNGQRDPRPAGCRVLDDGEQDEEGAGDDVEEDESDLDQ